MDKTESKPVSVARKSKENSTPSTEEALDNLMLGEKPDLALSEHDSDKSLDLVRKILFGEQVRATEKKQASLERHFENSVDSLNRETQQQLKLLRKDLQALEQKAADWRQEMLQQIEQASQQLQQNKVDRQMMADLLEGMAGQLKDYDLPAQQSGK